MTFAFGSFTLGAALLFSAFKNQSLVSLILGQKGEGISEQGESHPSAVVAETAPTEVGGQGQVGARSVAGGESGLKVPAGTPSAKAKGLTKMIAWAVANSHRWPYFYGGGHPQLCKPSGSPAGYDCSGSWSCLMAQAGIISTPMTSGAMAAAFAPGPGKYITLYANEGHVWGYLLGVPMGTGEEAQGKNRGGFAIGNGDVTNKGAYTECHPKGW